jgi:hypothetical protein
LLLLSSLLLLLLWTLLLLLLLPRRHLVCKAHATPSSALLSPLFKWRWWRLCLTIALSPASRPWCARTATHRLRLWCFSLLLLLLLLLLFLRIQCIVYGDTLLPGKAARSGAQAPDPQDLLHARVSRHVASGIAVILKRRDAASPDSVVPVQIGS